MLLCLWAFLALAIQNVSADMAEVGAFEALFFYSAYRFEAEAMGLDKTYIARGTGNGNEPYNLQQFITYIAPTRKVLERDEDGKQIPGRWIDLPRWDKVDWDKIESNIEDLEAVAYELIHSNFTSAYAQWDLAVAADSPFSDAATLTNQLTFLVSSANDNIKDKTKNIKKLYEKCTSTLQAISDSHRKAASKAISDNLAKFIHMRGRDYKLFFKNSDKLPVRAFRELDMEKTLANLSNRRDFTKLLTGFRNIGAQSDMKDIVRLNKRLNNIDNLQKTRQRLTPRPKRACTI